jgi:hypothetical protein
MIKKGTKHEWARGSVALLIVLIAFGIFLLFYNWQDSIMEANNFYPFVTLTVVGAGFLFGLLYLVNKPEPHKAKVSHKASKSSKKSKKVRK